MLSVDTVIKAANAVLNADSDPADLEALHSLTRLNMLAALAVAASEELPPVLTIAVSPDDFALLSGVWKVARDTVDEGGALPKPKLVTS